MSLIKTTDGKTLKRVSRWIHIQTNYKPNKRNALWDYARDGNGNGPSSKKFDKDSAVIDFFFWNGRTWAIEQFYSLSGPFGGSPMFFENEDGKMSYIAGYDSENYFNPILIEMSDSCEWVRVYVEV